jgi:hypothetical protein
MLANLPQPPLEGAGCHANQVGHRFRPVARENGIDREQPRSQPAVWIASERRRDFGARSGDGCWSHRRFLRFICKHCGNTALDRYLIRDAQRVIESVEALVRIHNTQEEDIYEHAAVA